MQNHLTTIFPKKKGQKSHHNSFDKCSFFSTNIRIEKYNKVSYSDEKQKRVKKQL